jgi:hypothetical protein
MTTDMLLGPLGLLVALLIALGSKMRGDWVTKGEFQRETEARERAEAQRDRLLLVVLELKGATQSVLEVLKESQGGIEKRGQLS